MPLKISLKPHEKIMIGNAMIMNGSGKTEFVILNQTPILRQKDFMSEEDADTRAKQLYLAILKMYTQPGGEAAYHDIYVLLLTKLIDVSVEDSEFFECVQEVARLVIGREYYKALKQCHKLIELEAKET